jgi:hypothetical protein
MRHPLRPLPVAVLGAALLAPWLPGCGGRTGLEASLEAHGADGVPGRDSGVVGSTTGDVCHAAVSGPKAMEGNCSTRDGRARAAAPTAPHVTWTTKLPTDSTGQVGLGSSVATDSSGNAYVVTTGELDETVAGLRRVRASDGTVLWTQPISPDEDTDTPILLSSGGIDLFGYAKYADEIFTFDPASGASTSTAFGFSLYYAPPDLAVGSDGSLYVTHMDDVGEAHQTTFISRVGPDGAVLWTSIDLGTLGPPPEYDDGEVFPSILALGPDDLVIVCVDEITATPGDAEVVSAFESATGKLRWSTVLSGQAVGGPVTRSDGAVVVLLYASGATSLVDLDPTTGAPTAHAVASGAFEIYAVTVDGVVLAGADTGSGVTGIVAIGTDGATLWTVPGPRFATIASDGTVIAFGQDIAALDPATGDTKWTLTPPSTRCVLDAALTSEGGLVALQCDGTLFGAGD